MRNLGGVLMLLACATLGVAQSVPLVVDGETTVVVKSLPFKVRALAGADLYIWSHPSAVKSSEDGETLTVTEAPRGEVTVKVQTVTIDWASKKVIKSRGQITFSVGVAPPIPPGPGPGPVPPGPGPGPDPDPWVPEDPLLINLRVAYGADESPTKAADVRKLAAIWRAASEDPFLRKAGTYQTLLADMHAAAQSQIGDRLKPVRAALSAETKLVVPDLSAKVTNGGGVKARALLLRFAALLDSLPDKGVRR